MQRNAVLVIMIASVLVGTFLFYRTSSLLPATAEFGGVSLNIEYALTEVEREKGLGGRESIESNYGLLFVFPEDQQYGFWMKGMLVPIDIFWLNDQGQVVSSELSVSPASYPHVFYPPERVRYVLEAAAGFAVAHAVATGTPLLLKKFPTVSK